MSHDGEILRRNKDGSFWVDEDIEYHEPQEKGFEENSEFAGSRDEQEHLIDEMEDDGVSVQEIRRVLKL
jgi:hypothetical protein